MQLGTTRVPSEALSIRTSPLESPESIPLVRISRIDTEFMETMCTQGLPVPQTSVEEWPLRVLWEMKTFLAAGTSRTETSILRKLAQTFRPTFPFSTLERQIYCASSGSKHGGADRKTTHVGLLREQASSLSRRERASSAASQEVACLGLD